VDADTRLDVIVMLTGTMTAAENEKYNENASIFDALREPYLSGEKDIHDIGEVEADFDLSAIDYLLIIICAIFLGYQMIFLAINAVARIFNMLLLYLAFPPIMAASPLDDGGKRKQWTTAFVVQCLSVFGAVMAMRLVTFCVPIIYSDSLNLFPDSSLSGPRDYIVKLFFLIAVAFTANKSIGMISGILADSAGYQSMSASNIGDNVVSDLKAGYGNAKGVADFITGKKKKDNQKQQENKGNAGRRDGGSGGKLSSGGSSSGHGASPTNHSQLGGGSDNIDKGKEASARTDADMNLSNLQNNNSMSMDNDTGNIQNKQGNPTEPQNHNNNVTGNTNKNDGNHVSVGRGNINNNNINNQEVNHGVQQMNLPQNNVMNHQEGENTNMQNVANEPPVKKPPINLHNMQ
jgi:uncharacterized membrane protein YgcG